MYNKFYTLSEEEPSKVGITCVKKLLKMLNAIILIGQNFKADLSH